MTFILNLSPFFPQDQESKGAKAFLEVAAENDEVPFLITSTADLFKEYKVDGEGVVLFKKVSSHNNIISYSLDENL